MQAEAVKKNPTYWRQFTSYVDEHTLRVKVQHDHRMNIEEAEFLISDAYFAGMLEMDPDTIHLTRFRWTGKAIPERQLPPGSAMGKLHEVLEKIRTLHCDRKDTPGHACRGALILRAGEVRLRCPLCGPLNLKPEPSIEALQDLAAAPAES